MQAKIHLKVVLTSWDYGIWISKTCYDIFWPQQPLTTKSAKIPHDFSWFYQKKMCSKGQNKAKFKNLDNFDVLSSDFEALKTSCTSLTSSASAASLASATFTTLFTQRTSLFWWFDHICHKMTNTGPFLWNGSSKILIFTEIWYSFCRRLLRPVDVIFLKNGCGTQKFPISAFQNHLQTKFNLHIFIRQS